MALQMRFDPKPVNGVVATEIPQELRDFMEQAWERVQKDADHDPVLLADSRKEVETYALYARAWGNWHEPRLTVRKLVARKDQPENEVRLGIKVYDEDAPKPGRKATSK